MSEYALSPEQLKTIEQLLLGVSQRKVAATLGIPRGTISSWMGQKLFSQAFREARKYAFRLAMARLQGKQHRAVDNLLKRLESSDENIALKAADILLSAGFKAAELGVVDERLTDLEEARAEHGAKTEAPGTEQPDGSVTVDEAAEGVIPIATG